MSHIKIKINALITPETFMHQATIEEKFMQQIQKKHFFEALQLYYGNNFQTRLLD